MSALGRATAALGRFLADLLFGEAPELFLGALALVGIALVCRHDRGLGLPLLVCVALAILAVSTARAARRT